MQIFNRKWWYAQLNLGFRVIIHFALKLWPFAQKHGIKQFESNYIDEGLPPYSPAHRAIAFEPGRCTACGSCDAHCPLIQQKDGDTAFIGPMRLVLSGFRGGPTVQDIGADLRYVLEKQCENCRACETACPESIPIISLAQEFNDQGL